MATHTGTLGIAVGFELNRALQKGTFGAEGTELLPYVVKALRCAGAIL